MDDRVESSLSMGISTREAAAAAAAGIALLLAAGAAAPVPGGAPDPPEVRVCWGYGCAERAWVRIPEPDWSAVVALLRPPAPEPAAERRRLRAAIALLDAAIGRLTPVGQDLAGSQPWGGLPGQQDCIDESLTTEALLQALERAGLLQWHRVIGRVRRAPFGVDVHWTAAIAERTTGRAWAVDPWFGDQGEPAVVQPLADWLRGAPPPDPPPRRRSRGLAARLLWSADEDEPF